LWMLTVITVSAGALAAGSVIGGLSRTSNKFFTAALLRKM
jgi:hypothetical protein